MDTCHKMSQKKTNKKTHPKITYGMIPFIVMPRKGKSVETECKLMVAWGWRWEWRLLTRNGQRDFIEVIKMF